MKMGNHRIKPLLLVLLATAFRIQAQELWPHGQFKELKRGGDRNITYLDIKTLDTLYENYADGHYLLKSKENVELSRGSLWSGITQRCGGCEIRWHGFWVRKYRNGNLREMGEYRCDRKAGTWTYYHENGNLQKIETYQLPYVEVLTEYLNQEERLKNRSYLLSGVYVEYHPNGKLKTEGRYEIVEAFSKTDTVVTFDPVTYQDVLIISEGEFWMPVSVKIGLWKEMDENGRVVKVENFKPIWYEDKKYRPLTSRYTELFSNFNAGK